MGRARIEMSRGINIHKRDKWKRAERIGTSARTKSHETASESDVFQNWDEMVRVNDLQVFPRLRFGVTACDFGDDIPAGRARSAVGR